MSIRAVAAGSGVFALGFGVGYLWGAHPLFPSNNEIKAIGIKSLKSIVPNFDKGLVSNIVPTMIFIGVVNQALLVRKGKALPPSIAKQFFGDCAVFPTLSASADMICELGLRLAAKSSQKNQGECVILARSPEFLGINSFIVAGIIHSLIKNRKFVLTTLEKPEDIQHITSKAPGPIRSFFIYAHGSPVSVCLADTTIVTPKDMGSNPSHFCDESEIILISCNTGQQTEEASSFAGEVQQIIGPKTQVIAPKETIISFDLRVSNEGKAQFLKGWIGQKNDITIRPKYNSTRSYIEPPQAAAIRKAMKEQYKPENNR